MYLHPQVVSKPEATPVKPGENRIALGEHPVTTVDRPFAALGLSAEILKSVLAIGFKHPTPIQSDVIPPALSGRDIIGLAQTGSGKTAAFVIPVIERLLGGKGLRGLVLSPTREIALQTEAFIKLLSRAHPLKTVCLIGGVKMGPQFAGLKQNPDIIVATPGRLIDHMERGSVRLSAIQELVIDEADHMLDLGFLPQIQTVLQRVPKQRHTMMFSATMPPAIERLSRQFLNAPQRIDILPAGRAAVGITHRLYLVSPEDKKNCLLALLHQELGSTLVFTRTKREADWLYRLLEKERHPVAKIHSDRSQNERTRALHGFKTGHHRILVATAIASRGIDVPGIEHIVNFDIPDTVEEYIHRAGRTARANKEGMVSTIATWQNKPMIAAIERAIKKPLPRCTVAGVAPYVELKVKPFGRMRRR